MEKVSERLSELPQVAQLESGKDKAQTTAVQSCREGGIHPCLGRLGHLEQKPTSFPEISEQRGVGLPHGGRLKNEKTEWGWELLLLA